MPNDRVFEEIIKELSEEFNLNKKVIRFIISNYYRNVRDIIREGDIYDVSTLKGIYIPGFGALRVKNKKRVEYIRNRIKNKCTASSEKETEK